MTNNLYYYLYIVLYFCFSTFSFWYLIIHFSPGHVNYGSFSLFFYFICICIMQIKCHQRKLQFFFSFFWVIMSCIIIVLTFTLTITCHRICTFNCGFVCFSYIVPESTTLRKHNTLIRATNTRNTTEVMNLLGHNAARPLKLKALIKSEFL